MQQILKFIFIALIVIACNTQNKNTSIVNDSFLPGELWYDTDSVHINAHGGGMIYYNDTYYWFGEHKIEGWKGNSAQVGVRCYSSKDLYNWKNEGVALAVSDDSLSDIVRGSVIERPKVIYNEKNKQFVMWFHLELKDKGYDSARTAVAVSDNITGPYKFLYSLRPNAEVWPVNGEIADEKFESYFEDWSPEWSDAVTKGMFVQRDFDGGQMSRDMTLFVDDDGTAYHIHAAEENLTLHISELDEDYTGFTGKWLRIFPMGHNEAPAIFKRKGKYFMITSGCTGWAPNAARLLSADSIMGEWAYHGNPAIGDNADKTFDSQSTYVFKVNGLDDAYIFMGDRWRPQNAIDGRYIWLPIEFENNMPLIKYYDKWKLSFF